MATLRAPASVRPRKLPAGFSGHAKRAGCLRFRVPWREHPRRGDCADRPSCLDAAVNGPFGWERGGTTRSTRATRRRLSVLRSFCLVPFWQPSSCRRFPGCWPSGLRKPVRRVLASPPAWRHRAIGLAGSRALSSGGGLCPGLYCGPVPHRDRHGPGPSDRRLAARRAGCGARSDRPHRISACRSDRLGPSGPWDADLRPGSATGSGPEARPLGRSRGRGGGSPRSPGNARQKLDFPRDCHGNQPCPCVPDPSWPVP